MERQKSQNSQYNIEEEQSWRTDTNQLQNLLLSNSNQDTVVLAKESINRSIEQKREYRIDLHKYSQLIFDKE